LAPQPVFRFLGHPLVMVGLYVFFVASIFLHGLVIWQDPPQQAAAIATGGLVLVATFAMLQRGAFEPRIVVELRDDQRFGGQSMFNVTDSGRATGAQVSLYYTRSEDDRHYHAATGAIPIFTSLIAATFQLPATSTRQLKVWAHRITAEGNSESLPARIEVQCGDVTHRVGAQQSVKQTVLSLDGPTCEVRIMLD
jgi:hypothetical protein